MLFLIGLHELLHITSVLHGLLNITSVLQALLYYFRAPVTTICISSGLQLGLLVPYSRAPCTSSYYCMAPGLHHITNLISPGTLSYNFSTLGLHHINLQFLGLHHITLGLQRIHHRTPFSIPSYYFNGQEIQSYHFRLPWQKQGLLAFPLHYFRAPRFHHIVSGLQGLHHITSGLQGSIRSLQSSKIWHY